MHKRIPISRVGLNAVTLHAAARIVGKRDPACEHGGVQPRSHLHHQRVPGRRDDSFPRGAVLAAYRARKDRIRIASPGASLPRAAHCALDVPCVRHGVATSFDSACAALRMSGDALLAMTSWVYPPARGEPAPRVAAALNRPHTPRPINDLTTATTSSLITGFPRCAWNPARIASARSSSRA